MLTRDFDYDLPAELIAQHPLSKRSASRLLYLPAPVSPPEAGRYTPDRQDRQFQELPDLLRPGDLLVLNDSRVFPARLYGRKASGGKVEVLIERLLDRQRVLAHVRASRSPKPGAVLQLPEHAEAEVVTRQGDLFELRFSGTEPVLEYCERVGRMPLPPYIEREQSPSDRERYQTVYARSAGAVAAPTAGLHFDDEIFQRLHRRGVEWATITLHVGAGTFQPVRAERVADHRMHSEYVEVPESVCRHIRDTIERGGRVVAVGTTVVRSLESAASRTGTVEPFRGETNLFITPGYEFKIIDALITNFHLPRSSLLMLVCAFGGYPRMMRAYRHAVAERYRFFSYGDAMLIENAV